MRALIHTDGASSGNPGPSGVGAVVEMNGKTHEIAEHIGTATNNIAEYTSLLRGLEKALALGASEADVYMDSELVVRQMLGRYKVKNEGLKPLFKRARALSKKFSHFKISHVPREQNTEADRLSKKALESDPPTEALDNAASDQAGNQGSFSF